MKKVVITIQMFALMAMFPVYLVVELNHETGRLPVNNSSSESIEKPEECNIQSALNPKDKGLPFLILNDGKFSISSQKLMLK